MTAVRNRGFQPMRDIPTVVWLLLTVVAAVAHRALPMPGWLMIHLLLLGAVTHAILVWSQYFSWALLRGRATPADVRTQTIRLILSNGGAVLVIAGVLSGIWAVTAAGAASLIVAVAWHGASLYRRARRSMPGRFGRTVRYYIAAAALLTVGAALGALLARGGDLPNLVLAHALINVLGWIGLTVAGTVVTLWPTILRTRADAHAADGAARALPWLAAGVSVAAFGAALAWLPVLVLGLAGYLGGLIVIGVSLWRSAQSKPPRSFSAMSVGMALIWWAGVVAMLIAGTIVAFADGTGFAAVSALLDAVVPYLAAGFAAQVLVGALSYLVPVVLGGGPSPVRTGTAAFDRGAAWRVTTANAALAVCALPVSSLSRVVASMLYLIAMASFLPIMFLAMRAQRRAKAGGLRLEKPGEGPIVPEGRQPRGRRAGQAVAGLLAVVLAVAVPAAADPAGFGWSAAPAGDADAPVKTVQVEAADMRFTPSHIEVPAGTRLVIELTNTDTEQVHDLVFANGIAGGRLAPGESQTIDVGVITADLDGWCSIIGHRQMGMTMTIVATGAAAGSASTDAGASDAGSSDAGSSDAGEHGDHAASGAIDLMADPGEDFSPYDAELPALPASDGPVHRRLTLTARDVETEVAPGVTQTLWTYNGTAPGPVLHGRVGDTFEITLVNDGSMGHSIDFHAGSLAPDRPMRTIAPGESLTYTFTATRAGIWMYHCSTMPMTAHIANGMYGAVVIEPDDLPAVDRSYVLVQGSTTWATTTAARSTSTGSRRAILIWSCSTATRTSTTTRLYRPLSGSACGSGCWMPGSRGRRASM
ncbi:multicopper oxidase domain-containing protein [Microbacterium sp. KUDC0406]|uniref:multicopper oxidase domain-containing protein n=1 Tax=Microbacterium sp. KUDC0406 TaxID=2909588 RepID=UPI001F26518A|nr:multicopper oxidase domain-containing protein [Microbacterium sp. KUDC0406]UJP08947.1 multicopper oxidase domain-containing protein [Microbacterium sp. KUDC0406]